MGLEPAVVSVASREPIDVERALKDARKIKADASARGRAGPNRRRC